MVNAATELAELLSQWRLNSNSPIEARGGKQDGDADFWREQSRCVGLLGEVDRAMAVLRETGKPVEHFEYFAPMWYRAVFSYSFAWGNGYVGSAPAIDEGALNALLGLGTVLDLMGQTTPLATAQLQAVNDAVRDIDEYLETEADGVAPGQREYVMLLTAALRAAAGRGILANGAELKRLIDQLVGALVSLATDLDEDSPVRTRLVTFAQNLVQATRTITYDLAAVATIVGAAPIVFKMLEG